MIKFFRNIRQRLLKEGRTTKYLTYAIGEIILVVIGILIALQINNWNEDRKNLQKEHLLLVQLKEEYTSNLAQLDRKIEMRTRLIHASTKLLSYIDTPEGVPSDSVLKYLGPSGYAPTFDPITNDLISAGKLSLIKNEKLKKLLSTWTSELVQLVEEEQNWNSFKDDIRTPFIVEHNLGRDVIDQLWKNDGMSIIFIDQQVEYDLVIGRSNRAIDYSKILAIPAFETLIAIGLDNSTTANVQSYALRQRIMDILIEIESSLGQNT
jgi:hypothetical protein